MALETLTREGSFDRERGGKVQFHAVYALMFGIFLVATIVWRLMPWRWSELLSARSKSIFDEARFRTNHVVPFVFMG